MRSCFEVTAVNAACVTVSNKNGLLLRNPGFVTDTDRLLLAAAAAADNAVVIFKPYGGEFPR